MPPCVTIVRITIRPLRRRLQPLDRSIPQTITMHANLAVDYFGARILDAEQKLLTDTVALHEQALQLYLEVIPPRSRVCLTK